MVYNIKYSNNIIGKLLACFPCLKNAKNLEILGNQYHKKITQRSRLKASFIV
jgi:hypothetical protein